MPDEAVEAKVIPPIPVAFLLCDQVITDEATKKKTLVGVFDRIWVIKFPTSHSPVALYARLFDAAGDYDIRVEYVKVKDQAVLGNATAKMHVANRHEMVEFSMTFPPIPIPEPGEYEFRLWINDRYIQRVCFTAMPHPTEQKQQ